MIDNLKQISCMFCIVLLCNVFMLVCAFYTDTYRTWVNIDYFIPLIFLMVLKKQFLFLLSFICVATFDFLQLFVQLFPAIRLGDVFYLLKFAWLASDSYKLYGILSVIVVLLQIALIQKIYRPNLLFSLLIVFNFFIIIYFFSHVIFDGRQVKDDFKKIVSSQLINYYEYYQQGFIKTFSMSGDVFQPVVVTGASAPLWSGEVKDKKILLIINESWGLPVHKEVHEDVISPLVSNRKVVEMHSSNLYMNGFTIAAEMRELCQKALNHFNLKKQKVGFEGCLPHIYKSKKYKTVAVHGALSVMYDRKYWYPRAGFDTVLFSDVGLNLKNSRCYSFPGNCDKDITKRINEQFSDNKKIFMYWLTLNTHTMYDSRDISVDLFDCKKFNVNPETESCRNLKLQKQFFYYLSQMFNSSSFNNTSVVIVGDHEPPIISAEERMFIKNKIPAISFRVIQK